jgi:hypothetical protein
MSTSLRETHGSSRRELLTYCETVSDEPPPDVDFVVGSADPGPDEDLPQPRDSAERSWFVRTSVTVAVAAAVLIGALVVARALSGDRRSTASAPTGSPSPSVNPRIYSSIAPDTGSGLLNGMATMSIPPGHPIPIPIGPGDVTTISIGPGRAEIDQRLPPSTSDDPAECPTGIDCYTEENAAASARAAVRAAFPGAVIQSASTVHLNSEQFGQMLWFVQINALVGHNQLVVRVQAPRDTDRNRSGADNAGDSTIAYYEHALRQYHVFVQVDGPAGAVPSVRSLKVLAHDVRLLAST